MSTGPENNRYAAELLLTDSMPVDFYLDPIDTKDDTDRFVSIEQVETGLFSDQGYSFDYYDDLSDKNVFLGPKESAKVFDYYFGQMPPAEDDISGYLESTFREEIISDIQSVEGIMVMDLNLFEYEMSSKELDYEEDRIVKRHEGKVSESLVLYLVENSSLSEELVYHEDMETLVVRPIQN